MNRYIVITFACALLILMHTACTSDKDMKIGGQFIQSSASIVCTDTISVELSSFRLDSIATSGKGVALVGRYKDENIGEISSNSYMIMGANNYTISNETDPVLDSLVLILKPNGYYYGDTSALYTMQIYQVIQKIETDIDEKYLYNFSSFDVNPILIGEKTFVPKPNLKNEIRVHINNDLATELFNKFTSSTHPFENTGGFTNYFKGIKLQTASTSSTNSIIGIDVNAESIFFNMYYHKKEFEDSDSLQISVSNTDLQFNQIVSDNASATLSLIGKDPILSDDTNNYAYLQGGTGIFTRIRFPYLKNTIFDGRDYKIIRADLFIQPSTIMNPDYLPKKLNIYSTNIYNDFLSVIYDEQGNQVTSTLVEDDVNRENTYYGWTITAYIKQLLAATETELNGILIVPESYDSKFDHVIITDQKESKYRTHLKLYVIYYE